MRRLTMLLTRLMLVTIRLAKAVRMTLLRELFKECGKNVKFDPYGQYTFSSIIIGSDVFIGSGAKISSERKVTIGNKVLIGPNVSIIGGDHNTSVIGKYMFDVKVKRTEDDQDIVIEDDVWIGACAIILKGVHINRGSVVAAGSIVTKDVPPYSVVAGSPARLIRMRFSPEQIKEHERLLGVE